MIIKCELNLYGIAGIDIRCRSVIETGCSTTGDQSAVKFNFPMRPLPGNNAPINQPFRADRRHFKFAKQSPSPRAGGRCRRRGSIGYINV